MAPVDEKTLDQLLAYVVGRRLLDAVGEASGDTPSYDARTHIELALTDPLLQLARRVHWWVSNGGGDSALIEEPQECEPLGAALAQAAPEDALTVPHDALVGVSCIEQKLPTIAAKEALAAIGRVFTLMQTRDGVRIAGQAYFAPIYWRLFQAVFSAHGETLTLQFSEEVWTQLAYLVAYRRLNTATMEAGVVQHPIDIAKLLKVPILPRLHAN